MKITKILAAISILLLIICIAGTVTLCLLPEQTTTTKDDPYVSLPVSDVILPLTTDAGQEYIDKIYFVGDSTTYHFFKGGVDRSHLLVPDSLTLRLSSDILSITVRNTDLTIPEAIKSVDAEIVIITVGVNGADLFTERQYKTYYKKLIDAIQELSPSTDIILQSVFPVTKEYSDSESVISNQRIDQLNEWAKDIAAEENIRYLDTQSILKNENGAQKPEYSEGDGVHMNSDAYEEIIRYIRTHALEK